MTEKYRTNLEMQNNCERDFKIYGELAKYHALELGLGKNDSLEGFCNSLNGLTSTLQNFKPKNQEEVKKGRMILAEIDSLNQSAVIKYQNKGRREIVKKGMEGIL